MSLNSTLNITGGGGFGPGTYTLFTYTGSLSGTPVLGTRPAGYNCSLDTNTPSRSTWFPRRTPRPPGITNQPASRSSWLGATSLFTVGASGSAPLSYQWRFNPPTAAGGTNAL